MFRRVTVQQAPNNKIRQIRPQLKKEWFSNVGWKMLQAGTLWSIGDLLAQGISQHRAAKERRVDTPDSEPAGRPPLSAMLAAWDSTQTLKQAFFASFVFAPLGARYYPRLGRLFPGPASGADVSTVAKRVAVDQTVWAFSILSMLFVYNSFVDPDPEGPTARERIRHLLGPTMITNWYLWVPLQLVNFFFVPAKYWFIFVNSATVPWTAYLAEVNTSGAKELKVAIENHRQGVELQKKFVESRGL